MLCSQRNLIPRKIFAKSPFLIHNIFEQVLNIHDTKCQMFSEQGVKSIFHHLLLLPPYSKPPSFCKPGLLHKSFRNIGQIMSLISLKVQVKVSLCFSHLVPSRRQITCTSVLSFSRGNLYIIHHIFVCVESFYGKLCTLFCTFLFSHSMPTSFFAMAAQLSIVWLFCFALCRVYEFPEIACGYLRAWVQVHLSAAMAHTSYQIQRAPRPKMVRNYYPEFKSAFLKFITPWS